MNEGIKKVSKIEKSLVLQTALTGTDIENIEKIIMSP